MQKRIPMFLLCLFLIVMSGCYSKREPKEMAVVISSMYDKKGNGNYSLTIEVMKLANTSKGKSGEISNIVETDEGPSLREAATNNTRTIEKSLYGGHNQVRFFSEAFAQNEADMIQAFDFAMRDHLTDETADVIVIKGSDPLSIYSASIAQSKTLGMFIFDHEKNQLVTGSKAIYKTALGFLKDYYIEGKEPVAGLVEIEAYNDPSTQSTSKQSGEGSGSSSQTKLNLEGLSVFKGMKLVGYLNGQGTRAYNFLTNNIKTSIITVPFDSSETVLEIDSSSCKAKIKLENRVAKIDVNVKIDTRVVTHGGKSDIYEADIKKQVELEFNKQMQAELLTAIQQVQGYKSDIFGFGQQLHIQNPKIWKTVKEQWNDLFSQASISVSVDSTIVSVGQLKDSVLSESEK